MVAQRRDWLHKIPPWRIPMPRRRRHHHHHVEFSDAIVAFLALMGWLLILEIGVGLWVFEAFTWMAVWFYYGMFLAARWAWHEAGRLLGRRADEQQAAWLASGRTGEEPTAPWPAQNGNPAADPWDTGTMRRRGRT